MWGIMNSFHVEIKLSVWNHEHLCSLLLWLVEISPVSSDLRGLAWKMSLICSEILKIQCERSVMKTRVELYRYVCGDIWHFVCRSQCWTCFGGMKHYRSYGSQSDILSPETKFLAFAVLFTSNQLKTTLLQSVHLWCYEQWCVTVYLHVTVYNVRSWKHSSSLISYCHYSNVNTVSITFLSTITVSLWFLMYMFNVTFFMFSSVIPRQCNTI